MNDRSSGKYAPLLSIIAFAAIYFAAAILALVWLCLDRAPPNWDDAWYLSNSLTLYDTWTSTGLLGLAKQFLATLGFKAPLITALPLPFYLIFGRRRHFALLVNLVAMLALFAAVWGIGNRLRGARAGLIAVYITATVPLLYGLSRWYMVEYPLAACVAAACRLLIVPEDFTRPWVAAALGIVCGFGMLLKIVFPVFVALPIGAALLRSRSWRRWRESLSRVFCRLVRGTRCTGAPRWITRSPPGMAKWPSDREPARFSRLPPSPPICGWLRNTAFPFTTSWWPQARA